MGGDRVDSDHDLFAEAMSKVKPIQTADKVRMTKPKAQRRHYSYKTSHAQITDQGASAQRLHATQEPWLWIADGISRENIKRLAGGQPAIGLNIDLHGFNRDAALRLLDDAMQQAMAEQIRVVCIVHGRGLHSEGGKAILKQAVYDWLCAGPLAHRMLAVISQPGSGGGACLVLLRRQK